MPNTLKDLQDRNRELLARIEELEKVNEPKEVTETEIEEIASSLEVPDEKVIEIVKSYFSFGSQLLSNVSKETRRAFILSIYRIQSSVRDQLKVKKEYENFVKAEKELREYENESWRKQINKEIEEKHKNKKDLTQTTDHLNSAHQDIEKLKILVANLEKVPDEQFKVQIHFLSENYPSQFKELEKRVGVGKATVDNFVQFLANKEWKARNGKWEIEQQKEKIKKQKNHLNSKYQTQINRLKSLSLIKNYYQDQDTKLRVTIKDLQDQINNHTCSGCHNSTHSDYDQLKTEKENLTTEKTTLQNENTNLTQTLKNLATNLGQQKNKTRNLTKFKKMLSEAIQDYKKELKSNKDQFRDFQFEIKSLKQDKSDLNDKIERFRDLKKDLYAQIREIKNNQKEQKQELTALKKESEEQQKTIQQLETEKQNWQQREQQLLVEIELLKNPPLTNTNKENLKQSVIVKEIIKEVIIKDLKNDELGLKISPQEEIKLNSLSLQEAESYRNQLIKNKFNHLENQIGKWEREREQSPSVFPRTERGENPSLNADYSIIYSDWWDGIVN